MGHFWIAFDLYFKVSPDAQPFTWKPVFIHAQMKINFHVHRRVPGLTLKKRPKVIRKWTIFVKHEQIVSCKKSFIHNFENSDSGCGLNQVSLSIHPTLQQLESGMWIKYSTVLSIKWHPMYLSSRLDLLSLENELISSLLRKTKTNRQNIQ